MVKNEASLTPPPALPPGTFAVEIPGYADLLAACLGLTEALHSATGPILQQVPDGVRPDIYRVAAVLSLGTWQEVVAWAARLSVDLRDLTAKEFSFLEHMGEKTAADWRSQGIGPKYRCEGRILYPLAEVWTWKKNGRQSQVAQKQRRGRRAGMS